MSFVKKTWKDRLVEFAGRRRLLNVDTGEDFVVDVTREEGLVTQVGDAYSAENMNDLESRIESGFSVCPTYTVIKKIEYVSSLPADAASHSDTLYLIPG